jgi:hypothetical protein
MPHSNRAMRRRRIVRKGVRTALIVKAAERLGHRVEKHLKKH